MNRLIGLGAVIVPIAVTVALYGYFTSEQIFTVTYESTPVDNDITALFRLADRDGTGYLDPNEFQEAVLKILRSGVHPDASEHKENAEEYTQLTGDVRRNLQSNGIVDEEIVPLTVKFKPFEVSAMAKFSNPNQTDQSREVHFTDLKSWQKENIAEGSLPAGNFSFFLPPDPIGLSIGKPWYLISDLIKIHGKENLPNFRYYPPNPSSKVEHVLFTILSMFHSRPFLHLRFGPRGTIACVRALNRDLIDIVFRVHAEFQVNEPPRYPYWFTPAQFAGRIIMDKESRSVKYFTVYVPNTQKLNVDMEWVTGKKQEPTLHEQWDMEVDIGYQPEMSIVSSGSYKPTVETEPNFDINNIVWDSEISEKEARSAIEKVFFPFKNIPYLPFDEAFKAAKEQDRLVHSILLWGTLDDQAC